MVRVSRPMVACQRCRTSKQKCDGQLPTCGGCLRSGKASNCSYANDPFARGKERSYVAFLEGQVEKLEKLVAQARATRSSVPALESGHAMRSPVALSSGSRSAAQRDRKAPQLGKKARQEAVSVEDLVSDLGLM